MITINITANGGIVNGLGGVTGADVVLDRRDSDAELDEETGLTRINVCRRCCCICLKNLSQ